MTIIDPVRGDVPLATYHALDSDAQRTLLTILRDTSWSWKESEVPALTARLGWEIAELSPTFAATVDPGHGLGDRAYRFSFRDGRVSDVTLRVTSQVPKNDPTGQLFLSDVFTAVHTVATEVLGAPTGQRIGELPQLRWRGDQTTIIVQLLSSIVTVFWRYNERQDELDRIAENFYR